MLIAPSEQVLQELEGAVHVIKPTFLVEILYDEMNKLRDVIVGARRFTAPARQSVIIVAG